MIKTQFKWNDRELFKKIEANWIIIDQEEDEETVSQDWIAKWHRFIIVWIF